MRVPLSWLREYCDPPLDVHGIEERQTMTGTKVEAIHHHGVRSLDRFLVGGVLSVERHPNADRLVVCEIDLGDARPEGPATIVCGAENVVVGKSVAIARPGAIMPDGGKLEKAKLRGVASEGMILAEDELGISTEHGEIIILEEHAPEADLTPGSLLEPVLPIATEVLELEITPNRPDCLGIYGVARELHAATGAPLAPAPWSDDPGTAGAPAGAEVEVLCPDLCPRFTARVFEEVTVGPSPLWLKARLTAAGQRPINNVVDITNYVMLLTGQPLHAFDLDRVAGGRLTVRRATEGERVATLDGQERTLDGEMVVIEDAEGPTSIAGLMGGARSEVSGETGRVLMEVANWHGPNIHRTSWTLGLRSEASSRFEKGLAPEQCMHAQALAARLMIDLCGARLAPGTIDIGGEPAPAASIHLRAERVEAILGTPVARERQAEILRALDFEVRDAGDPPSGGQAGLDVTVPALRRQEVTREADLIEEVARIDGLERLPTTLPKRRGAYGMLSPTQRLHRRALDALIGQGLYEVVGWTFTAAEKLEHLRLSPEDPARAGAVELENPLSEDQALLRTTLLCSLLDVAAHNVARGIGNLALFEIGTVFARAQEPAADSVTEGAESLLAQVAGETGVRERRSLGVLLAGHVTPPSWRDQGGAGGRARADFFALKGVLEALCGALRVGVECIADPEPPPFLHPGRAGAIMIEGESIGWLGELHPLVSAWDVPGAAVMELDLDRLLAAGIAPRGYVDLISFPPLREDIAAVLPQEIPAAEVIGAIRGAGGKLLDGVELFDVYTGPQVGESRRSLALSLVFRSPERTLTEEEVAPVRERIVAALEELGGELRA
ncbi:MAG TPA: phenylalanine--tRNA ligase subunit beta [Solirubrobacteraceae bacterium]|nr:phenylalanine--tRNA ligase subunit beta [Solirubrobacteraceae bacterium]